MIFELVLLFVALLAVPLIILTALKKYFTRGLYLPGSVQKEYKDQILKSCNADQPSSFLQRCEGEPQFDYLSTYQGNLAYFSYPNFSEIDDASIDRIIVFVHGGPGSPTRSIAPGLCQLVDRLREAGQNAILVFYDQRGCGKSHRPFHRFNQESDVQSSSSSSSSSSGKMWWHNMQRLHKTLGIGAQLADLEIIRRKVAKNRQITLIGHSFGSFLALMYAAEFPNAVDRLVLLNPADLLVFPAAHEGLIGLIKENLPSHEKIAFETTVRDIFDFRNLFLRTEEELVLQQKQFAAAFVSACRAKGSPLPSNFFEFEVRNTSEEDHSNKKAYVNPPSRNGGWMVHSLYFGLGASHDYRPFLRSTRCDHLKALPMLFVHGKLDLQPVDVSEAYASLFPMASVLLLDRSGHFPFVDEPEKFSVEIFRFLLS